MAHLAMKTKTDLTLTGCDVYQISLQLLYRLLAHQGLEKQKEERLTT